MCLAVPGKIVLREDMLATVDISGVTRQVSMMLLPDAQVGVFVLVHAGFAVQAIDEEEARQTMELFKELEKYAEQEAKC
jgi:hydrogenase expression/formation protein HypC